MIFLLDTCVFIWTCVAPERLSQRACEALSEGDAELLLSDASVLEVALKWSAEKLTLPKPPRSWIEDQAAAWSITCIPISRETIYRSAELPQVHKDPFDRLIVAAALEVGATIITPDEAVQRYEAPWLW